MSEIIRELAAKISVQTDEESIKKTEKALEALKGKLSGLASKLGLGEAGEGIESVAENLMKVAKGGVGAVAAIAALGVSFAGLGIATAEHASKMSKGAEMTGLGVDKYQELAFAAKESGVDADALNSTLSKLSRTLASASDGSKEAKKHLAALGVAATNGKFPDAAKSMALIADQTQALGKDPTRSGKVMAVLGKSAFLAIPWLNKGSKEMEHAAHVAHRYGVILSSSTLVQAKAFKAAKKEIEASIEGISFAIGSAALPLLTQIAKGFVEFQPIMSMAFGHVFGEFSSALNIMKTALYPVTAALEAFEGSMAKLDGLGTGGTGERLKGIFAGILSPITTAHDTLQDLMYYLTGKASAIGLSLAKDKTAYINEVGSGRAMSDLRGNVLKPGEQGGVQGALGAAPEYLSDRYKEVSGALSRGNYWQSVWHGGLNAMGLESDASARNALSPMADVQAANPWFTPVSVMPGTPPPVNVQGAVKVQVEVTSPDGFKGQSGDYAADLRATAAAVG